VGLFVPSVNGTAGAAIEPMTSDTACLESRSGTQLGLSVKLGPFTDPGKGGDDANCGAMANGRLLVVGTAEGGLEAPEG
jgi:hypothetical protein